VCHADDAQIFFCFFFFENARLERDFAL